MSSYEWKLADIFQSGMIFQREKEILIWGYAPPGTVISAAFYKGTPYEGGIPFLSGEGAADEGGSFQLRLPPQRAGSGYCLLVSASQMSSAPILLENLCFGDIWLAGGQSNMEFFLKYDRDWEKVKGLPRNPDIRMYNVPQRAFEGHTTHNTFGYGTWFDDSDPKIATFSAPAYSFARSIQASLNIPIGIIGCNWGGSSASAWVPKKVLDTPALSLYLKEYEDAVSKTSPEKLKEESLSAWKFEDSAKHGADFEPLLYGRSREWQLDYMKQHADDPVVPMGPYHFNRPCGLYHTMLSKIIPFPLKGVLWYQGESDAGDRAFVYDKLLTGLIASWRSAWNDELPFLLVQLAPFGIWLDCDSTNYRIVRQKQEEAAQNIPHVYLTSIMDIGSYYDIHPKEKLEVGRRLALLARGHIYGEAGLLCDPPKAIRAILQKDGQLAVSFAHAEGLSIGEEASDWEITAGSLSLKPAAVKAEGNHILLFLPDGFIPERVSLGWHDYGEIYIHNRAGLSAAPFSLQIEQEVSE